MDGFFEIGDIVFAREDLFNDGYIPEIPEDALLARAGGRGVVVKTGVVEADESTRVYLVRFEDEKLDLGPPVGCMEEELTQDEEEAKRLLAA